MSYGEIPNGYQVHHKDENKHNNKPDNLELLSEFEHKSKHAKIGVSMVKLKCPSCKKFFEREFRNTHLSKSRKTTYTACSRKCSGIFSHKTNVEKEKGIFENVISVYVFYFRNPEC